MTAYSYIFFISLSVLYVSLFTSWACMFPFFSHFSLSLYFSIFSSSSSSTSLSSSMPPSSLFLFLSLLHKHLPSLWSRGWQDKKHVSIRQSRKGRIDSETKEGFTAVYEYMCVCVHNMCAPLSILTCMRSCLSRTLGYFSWKRQKME